MARTRLGGVVAARWARNFVKIGGEAWTRGSFSRDCRGDCARGSSLAWPGLGGVGRQVGAEFRKGVRRGVGSGFLEKGPREEVF